MKPTGGGGGGGTGVTAATGLVTGEYAGTVIALTAGANTLSVYGLPFPNLLTFAHIGVNVNTADAVNNYDIGIYNSSGTLIAHIGAQTLPSTGMVTFAVVGGAKTLTPAVYYLATTGAATTASLQGMARELIQSFNSSYGSSAGGALPASITPPTLTPVNQPTPALLLY